MLELDSKKTYFSLRNADALQYPYINTDWTQDDSLLSVFHKSWHRQYAEYLGGEAATILIERLHTTGLIYEHDRAGTLVASDKGSIVGVAAIRKLPKISLVTLYEVIPEYQGKGVGRQLLESLCSVSGPIVAHVSIHRPWIIPVYRRHGFKAMGTELVDHFGYKLLFEVLAKA